MHLSYQANNYSFSKSWRLCYTIFIYLVVPTGRLLIPLATLVHSLRVAGGGDGGSDLRGTWSETVFDMFPPTVLLDFYDFSQAQRLYLK